MLGDLKRARPAAFSAGKGRPLTPDNVRLDQGECRWRCRHCGCERAAAFRGAPEAASLTSLIRMGLSPSGVNDRSRKR